MSSISPPSQRNPFMKGRTVRIALLSILAIFALPLALYLRDITRWGTLDYRLRNELEMMSRPNGPSPFLDRFDLVCFNKDNDLFRQEFVREARRLGKDFFAEHSCGVDDSCCSDRSDTNGVIGLVEKNSLRCVDVYSFAFVLAQDKALCVAPQKLIIEKKTFTRRESVEGRGFMSTPGAPYFSIGGAE
jgi:hypothetical protein